MVKKKAKKSTQKSTKKSTKKATPKRAAKKEKDAVSIIIKKHKDKNGGHNHIIVDNIDNCHVSVGITTKKKKGKNAPNYGPFPSPLNDGKESYMRRQGQVAPKREYFNERKGLIGKEHYQQAKIYGERAKEKYINKKNNDKPNT